jgi:hypothetical protein
MVKIMLRLLLLIIFVLSGALYLGDDLRAYGFGWAYQVCLTTSVYCNHSGTLAMVLAVTGVAYVILTTIRTT